MEATRQMNQALLDCAEPRNQDVVRGILAALFAAAGTTFAARKLEEAFAKEFLCDVELLRGVTLTHLRTDLGMTLGEAMAVDKQIFPPTAHEVVAEVIPGGDRSSAHVSTPGTRNAPEFPGLGADGLPSTDDMRAWLPGFRSHITTRVSELGMLVYDALVKDVKYALPDLYKLAPTPDSEAVMTALLTAGTKGLPSGIVLSFSPTVVDDRLGLVALQDLLARVFTVSDGSLGVLLAWFQKPDFITQAWLLGLGLTNWIKIRNQLISGGLPQSDIACRLSLLHLCSKLVDLKAVFAALEVAHPDGIPIQVLIDMVRSKSNTYSSLKTANTEVSVLAESYTLVAHHEKPGKRNPRAKSTRECRQWLKGPCSYGDNCIFKHTGVSGQGAAGETAALAEVGALLKELKSEVAELKATKGGSNVNNNNLIGGRIRSTATSELVENQVNQVSRFNSYNIYDALSVSYGGSNKDANAVSVLSKDSINLGIDNDNNISLGIDKDDSALSALSKNVICDNISKEGCGGPQVQDKAPALHRKPSSPKDPNKPLFPRLEMPNTSGISAGLKPLLTPPESVCTVPAVLAAVKGPTLGVR
jgi:hypothetical protein